MITRKEFCLQLLDYLGNKNPSKQVIDFMVAWSIEESGHNLSGMARYNLWNTTMPLNGSTRYNSVGVQNYNSLSDGIKANYTTISNGLYLNLVYALASNNGDALTNMTQGVMRDLSVWVSGSSNPINHNYVSSIMTLEQSSNLYYNDVLPGGSMAPQGWSDDGTTLTAPNNFNVVLGFRDHILSSDWDPDNWPLENEHLSDPLETSNPSIGHGTSQTFRKTRLEYTENNGVFEGWIGQEYLHNINTLNDLKTQVTMDQQKIANLKNGLPKEVLNSLLTQLNSLVSVVEGLMH